MQPNKLLALKCLGISQAKGLCDLNQRHAEFGLGVRTNICKIDVRFLKKYLFLKKVKIIEKNKVIQESLLPNSTFWKSHTHTHSKYLFPFYNIYNIIRL
jgi:flavoprotein